MPHRRNLRTAATGDPVDVLETEMTRLARTIALVGRPQEPACGDDRTGAERNTADRNIDRAGYLLLRTLERIGPASINTIAAAVGLDGSTVTRQVAAMKELGLVERQTNPGDRRSCIISPTADGRNVMRQMRRQRRSNLDQLTSDWSEDDRTALGRLLAKLNDSIARATGYGEATIAQSAG